MLAERQLALQKLLEAVAKLDYHLNSGEVGLKQVFCTLALEGENDTVYRMVTNPAAPSYRHYVEQGLTTLPEYWNYTELWNVVSRRYEYPTPLTIRLKYATLIHNRRKPDSWRYGQGESLWEKLLKIP